MKKFKEKNQQKIRLKYRTLKKTSFILFKLHLFSIGFLVLEYALNLALQFPFLHSYCDDEVEDALIRVIKNRENSTRSKGLNSTCVVLYASRLIERGALTKQYFDYLLKRENTILLILPTLHKSDTKTTLFRQAMESPKVEVFVPNTSVLSKKYSRILDKISRFKPYRVFIHMDPIDIVGFMVFSSLDTPKKFYIVHNDHTFWLGKNCADYFIEFRSFGLQVSSHRRQISSKKLILNKFYPILDSVEFVGLPSLVDGKIVGLIAGNLDKILMDPDRKWLKIVVEVLKSYQDLVIVIAGAGASDLLMKFIESNSMQNRMIFLGYRNDYTELVKNVDLVLATYPLTGGLIAQYAAAFHKPIVGYSSLELCSVNEINELFHYCDGPVVFTSKDDYLNAIRKIIFSIRKNDAVSNNEPMTELLFEDNLRRTLGSLKPAKLTERSFKHDDKVYLQYYLSLRNRRKTNFVIFSLKRLISELRSIRLSKHVNAFQRIKYLD